MLIQQNLLMPLINNERSGATQSHSVKRIFRCVVEPHGLVLNMKSGLSQLLKPHRMMHKPVGEIQIAVMAALSHHALAPTLGLLGAQGLFAEAAYEACSSYSCLHKPGLTSTISELQQRAELPTKTGYHKLRETGESKKRK